MFSLLNPFLLWFAPLLAAPLVIHFLGRAEPKVRDFPSLLPVEGALARAMQRHRLKNWLLLLLRTLVLLCLLLAAVDPLWRRGGIAPPSATGMLLHNGAYADAPRGEAGETWLRAQQTLARGLDSLTPGRARVERVLPDAAGPIAERFGAWPEAAARLLQRLNARATHVYLPLFDARDLGELAPALKPWLEADDVRRTILLDFTDARAGLDAFGEASLETGPDGTLRLRMATRARHAPLWIPDAGGARETQLHDGVAEIPLPAPAAGWVTGAFALHEEDAKRFAPAARRAAVAIRVPPPARVCLVAPRGGGGAARASLGEDGPRLRRVEASDDAGLGAEPCAALVLADPEQPGSLLARAAATLRAGGRVIVIAGTRADAALLNRNLLAPLGIGRLGEIHEEEARAIAVPSALARLGARAMSWGEPGTVRRRLRFTPAESTTVLLQTASDREPLLAHRGVGPGALLLWTTDFGDPDWSDLGTGPWPALMHAVFLQGVGAPRAELYAVDTDSTRFFAVDGEGARLLDPDEKGARWRPDAAGGRAGPFDRSGIHRLITPRDTLRFAARLAPERLAPPPDDAWKAFDAALGSAASARVVRLGADAEWRTLYDGIRLRALLLILAALLLFAEGVVSLRLSPQRTFGNRN